MADMKTLSDGKNTFNVVDPNALHLTEGKLTEDLSLGNHKIVEVADPVADTDAANKKYVDAKDTETLTAAKLYTDEKVVDGGSSGLVYEPLTFEFSDGAMTRAPVPSTFVFYRGLGGKIGNIVFIEVIAFMTGGGTTIPVKVGTYSGDVLTLIENELHSNLDGIVLHDPVHGSDYKGSTLELKPNGEVYMCNNEFDDGYRHLTGFFIIE